jgi:hypothetical protein
MAGIHFEHGSNGAMMKKYILLKQHHPPIKPIAVRKLKVSG